MPPFLNLKQAEKGRGIALGSCVRDGWMWEVDETKGDLESVNTEFLENFDMDE